MNPQESKPAPTAASPKPAAPPLPTIETVPPELASLRRWVAWRYALNPDGTRWVKLPVSARTGQSIGANHKWEPEWTDFAAARAGAARLALDGVGFVFDENDGFVGIDFDNCRMLPDGRFRPIPSRWINNFDTYGEISPSGSGVHLIARGTLPAKGNKSPLPDDVFVKCEMYQRDRFFTFTGQRLPGKPLAIKSQQPQINALHHHVFADTRRAAADDPGFAGVAREFWTDDRIIARITQFKKWTNIFNAESKAEAFVAEHYKGDDSAADLGFCTLVARYTMAPAQIQRLWRESILWREKSATRADYRLTTITRALAEVAKRGPRPVNTTDVADVAWLWPNRFPRGKLVLIDGDPGQAKSMFSLAVAVSVMTGKPLLDGTKPEITGGVVLLSAEDDLRDTINPRLVAAGAPQGSIPMLHVASTKPDGGQFSLGDASDRDALEMMIARIDAKLVIIDPLNAYLGEKVDSHNDQKIRQVLGPLSEIANKSGVVMLCLRHLAKSGGTKAMYRGMGSIGYTAAARANFFVAEHPEKKKTFVIAASKFNLGPKPQSLEYRIETIDVQGLARPVPRVAGGAPCDITADELSSAQDEKNEIGGKLGNAISFLRERLAQGSPVNQKQIEEDARREGIKWATVRRAKVELGVKSIRRGTAWLWSLQDEMAFTNDAGSAPRAPF